jgi:hypothetical protein
MKLEIIRKEEFPDRVLGGFYINGSWFAYSLEDTDRRLEDGGIKIPKETAIPRGRYRVIIDWSNRFKRMMPHILDVPQFTGIRIHDGGVIAEPIDTEGCPIVGYKRDPRNNLLESNFAFFDLFDRLAGLGISEEVWLEVL